MDIFELAALFTVLGSAWKIVRTIWKYVGSYVKKAVICVLDALIAVFAWIKRILSEDDGDSAISNNGVTGGVLRYF